MAPYQMQSRHEVGSVTVEQMREVDRIMVEDLHIELVQMMENAGRSLARVAVDLFAPRTAAVYAGKGGNGGGAMVAARHLANRGVDVTLVAATPVAELTHAPAHQFDILERMGVPVASGPVECDLAVDGLVGYGLKGDLRDASAELASAIDETATSVLSLDVPSGVDADTGSPGDPAVTADATLTLGLPKPGLFESGRTGTLYVADISVPPTVYERIGVGPAPDFGSGPIIRLI